MTQGVDKAVPRSASTKHLFELATLLRSLAVATGRQSTADLPSAARWIIEHWTVDPDFLNELSIFLASKSIDFEIRAEILDRIYQATIADATGGQSDALIVWLIVRAKYWDPLMTGVVVMIDQASGRLARCVLALPRDGAGGLERSCGLARIGQI